MRSEYAVDAYESYLSSVVAKALDRDSNVRLLGISVAAFVGCLKRCGRLYASLRRWEALLLLKHKLIASSRLLNAARQRTYFF